jgi:hypothetical protein
MRCTKDAVLVNLPPSDSQGMLKLAACRLSQSSNHWVGPLARTAVLCPNLLILFVLFTAFTEFNYLIVNSTTSINVNEKVKILLLHTGTGDYWTLEKYGN